MQELRSVHAWPSLRAIVSSLNVKQRKCLHLDKLHVQLHVGMQEARCLSRSLSKKVERQNENGSTTCAAHGNTASVLPHTSCSLFHTLPLQYVEGQNESVNTTCTAHGNAASALPHASRSHFFTLPQTIVSHPNLHTAAPQPL